MHKMWITLCKSPVNKIKVLKIKKSPKIPPKNPATFVAG